MMRVLQVIDTSEVGGGQTAVAHLLRGLTHVGVCTALACSPGGPLMTEAASIGVASHAIPFDKRFSPAKAGRLARVVHEGRFDLVHSHGLLATYYAVLARECFGVNAPLIYHQHGFHHHNHGTLTRRARIAAEAALCWRSDRVVAVSTSDLVGLRAGRYGPSRRLRLVHYGLPEPPAVAPAAARATLGVAADVPVVGLVARLHPQKGVETFLRAARIVHQAAPAVRFAVIGTGALEPSLRALAGELGLLPVVDWTTDGTRGVTVMPAFDVAVLASRWEGLPLVLLEYMALRRPIVATAVQGCLDAVGPSQASIVPPDDPASMATAILELLADRDRAATQGEAARARFEEQFTLAHMVDRVVGLYGEVRP